MLGRAMLMAATNGWESGDPNTLLLLHGDGSNGSTSIIDSSIYNLTAILAGTTQISTTQAKSGFGQSIWVPNSSSQITYTPLPSQYNFGSGDFTIQYFIYPTHASASYARYITLVGGTYPNANYREVAFRQNNATNSQYELYYLIGTTLYQVTSGTVSRNVWQHHAIVKNGTTLRAYVNGVVQGSLSNVTHTFNFSSLYIAPGLESGNGYYDEVKVSNSAVYTANFTPPSAPFTS